MIRPRFWIAALLAGCLAAPVWADAAPTDAAQRSREDARALAAKIDRFIAARLAAEKVTPAPVADDGAYLRRLSLDVIGRIPSVSETRRFLRDPGSIKREQSIERLLDSPGYVTNFSNIWRDLLLPEANADFQQRFLSANIERWLRKEFADNVPYDRMVRELITLPMQSNRQNMFYNLRTGAPSPLAFYMSKQGKPENLAATTSRLFLGVRLECAQCHNHPFGRWTREQFWGQAAFFGGIRSQGNNNNPFAPLSEVANRRELAIPGTERVVQARFLDGKEPVWRYKADTRNTLADWMTAADNPFFAKAAVNRLWAHFFGVGIVEPVDDFSDKNQPSHPELLDELARQFASHGFDYRFLIRAITLSKTYQLSSVHPESTPPDVQLFARMPVKGLSQDQLYESLIVATGTPNPNANQRRFAFNSPQNIFQAKFTNQEKRTEYQTSIPQALALMNSKMIADATHPQRSEFLAAVTNAPFLDTAGRIETLYLATLSRKPRAEELEHFRRYIEKGGAAKDPKTALADVFWALLNSTEFFLNH
ncbi:MAG TPA: DUF1549 and DUF1553 domain-containing protein [Gemmataceae bacterium]|nr:DUF1549 and DUF1553 domain-containing protein [Gemmataceae bacterium]